MDPVVHTLLFEQRPLDELADALRQVRAEQLNAVDAPAPTGVPTPAWYHVYRWQCTGRELDNEARHHAVLALLAAHGADLLVGPDPVNPDRPTPSLGILPALRQRLREEQALRAALGRDAPIDPARDRPRL